MGRFIDLTGQRFGRLVVIERAKNKNNHTAWKCKCDCGNETVVDASNLRSGSTTSCGCYHQEIRSSKRKNLTGMVFNDLIVIEFSGRKYIGNRWRNYWLCKCVCGNVTEVESSLLTNNHTKSCGCRTDKARRDRLLDMAGKRIGMLTVVNRIDGNWKDVHWLCKCDCGNEKIVNGVCLRNGSVSHCGCQGTQNYTNGQVESRTRLYGIYHSMKRRCYDVNDPGYKKYGKRGIKICAEWLGDNGYFNFREWSLSHGYQENLSIDRIDNDGNYEPSNCRWATDKQQANNTRRNHCITFNGEKHTISEWSDITGINRRTIHSRLKRGWLEEDALTQPVGTIIKHKKGA